MNKCRDPVVHEPRLEQNWLKYDLEADIFITKNNVRSVVVVAILFVINILL